MTSLSAKQQFYGPAVVPGGDPETDVEDEVDQLDSDSDVGPSEADQTNSTHHKGRSGNAGVRVPGSTLLPAMRLENIIQAEGVTGNLALSKEGLFVLSIAAEEFIKRISQAGHRHASAQRRNVVNYGDMAVTIQQYQEFMFLHDTIPMPISLYEALQLRDAKERELLEEDPAITSLDHLPSLPSNSVSGPVMSTLNASKPKPKKNTTNGKERVNGDVNASSNRRDSRRPDRELRTGDTSNEAEGLGAWVEETDMCTAQVSGMDSSMGMTPSSSSKTPPIANGHSLTISRSGTLTPAHSRDGRVDPPSPQRHVHHSHTPEYSVQEDSWPGQFTGPASGFLQGPGGPFVRPPQNPGRTIYSQSHLPD